MFLLLILEMNCLFGLVKVQVKKEKALAIQYAAIYLKHVGRPYGTPVIRIVEGAEPKDFWKHFA